MDSAGQSSCGGHLCDDEVLVEVPDTGFEEQLAQAKRQIDNLEQAVVDAREELQFFVYAASHDLQQPLRAISTHAQLLQRELPEEARARELLSVITDSSFQMNQLITSLLTYSRNGNSSDRNQVKLNAPAQWAIYNLSAAIQKADAKVTVIDELPTAFVDEKQMATVFENLLSNSLKFRGQDAPQIEVGGREEDDGFTILVRDNGCGISPEYHEKVFEPFKRLHGKQIPGNGLGLAMCRKILRAHEGKIWVESDGVHGTTMKFLVPK